MPRPPLERTPEVVRVAEPDFVRDVLDRQPRVAQQRECALAADRVDHRLIRHALIGEPPPEGALAHAQLRGDRRERRRVPQVAPHDPFDRFEKFGAFGFGRQRVLQEFERLAMREWIVGRDRAVAERRVAREQVLLLFEPHRAREHTRVLFRIGRRRVAEIDALRLERGADERAPDLHEAAERFLDEERLDVGFEEDVGRADRQRACIRRHVEAQQRPRVALQFHPDRDRLLQRRAVSIA